MILHALIDYYNNNLSHSPMGYSVANVRYCIVIDKDGKFVALEDIRQKIERGDKTYVVDKKLSLPRFIANRGTAKIPHYLADDGSYILGVDSVKQERSITLHQDLLRQSNGDPSIHAVTEFLKNPVITPEAWQTIKDEKEGVKACFVFKISGEVEQVHDMDHIRSLISNIYQSSATGHKDICLIDGSHSDDIAVTHTTRVSGVSSDGKPQPLVAANANSICSHGREKSLNSPISRINNFKYATALNKLLSDDKRHSKIGNMNVVFWSDSDSCLDLIMSGLIGPRADFEIENDIKAVTERIFSGGPPPEFQADDQFYVLGMTENAARISVRLWHDSTMGELYDNLKQHIIDMRIGDGYLSLFGIAASAGRKNKNKYEIPNKLPELILRSIIYGWEYPRQLLQNVLHRITVEREVSTVRASVVRGCHNRNARLNGKKEIGMSLDPDNNDFGYNWGRLFATYAKLQLAAHNFKKINSDIQDKYFASAISNPKTVFVQLAELSRAHLSMCKGRRFFDNLIEEIMAKFGNEFPSSLTSNQQVMFVLGFYHQQRSMNKPKVTAETTSDETTESTEAETGGETTTAV